MRLSSRTKRSIVAGSATSPADVSSSFRFIDSTSEKPRLGMKGNGCAGSIATGVRAGKISRTNQAVSQARSSIGQRLGLQHLDPLAAHRLAQRAPAALLFAHQGAGALVDRVQLFPGVSPSALRAVTPAWIWLFSPATRTM